MRYIILITLLSFTVACDSSQGNNNDENDKSTVANEQSSTNFEDVQVEFMCDSMANTNEYILTVLLSTYQKSIPIDTLKQCATIAMEESSRYQAPDNIEALAQGDDYIYYNAIQKDQLIIMRSPRNQTMNYQVFLSIPLKPVVNEEKPLQEE